MAVLVMYDDKNGKYAYMGANYGFARKLNAVVRGMKDFGVKEAIEKFRP